MSTPRRSSGQASPADSVSVPKRAVAGSPKGLARITAVVRARRPLVAAVAALSLVIGGGAVWYSTANPAPAQAAAAPLPATDVSATVAPTPAGPTTLAVPDSAAPVTADTMAPGTLLVPSAGIYVRWQPESVRDGQAVVPTDGTAGLWDDGATPRSTSGIALMWAHVDDGKGGAGPFAGLAQTVPQGAVYVRDQSGILTVWQVTRIYTEPRTSTHPDLFTTQGPRQLALVTCGGAVTSGGHYLRNVIVIAQPQAPQETKS